MPRFCKLIPALTIVTLGNSCPVQADASLISDNAGWRVFSELVPLTQVERCLMVRLGDGAAIVAASSKPGESFFLVKRDDPPEMMELRFESGDRFTVRDQLVQFESWNRKSDFLDILLSGDQSEFQLVDPESQKTLELWSLEGSDVAFLDWTNCISRIDPRP